MEKGGLGMGVTINPLAGDAASLTPGAGQEALLNQVTDELQDKGFVLANVDKIVLQYLK